MRGNFSFSAADITFSGQREKKIQKKTNFRHCYDDYAIVFIKRGAGRLSVEGSAHDFSGGALAILKPFKCFGVELDADGQYERYTVTFKRGSLAKDVASHLDALVGKEETDNGSVIAYDSLTKAQSSVFERFDYAKDLPENEAYMFMKMLVSELIILISSSESERMKDEEMDLSARVIRYINSFLFSDISLDFLAKRFFVSKYYLCRSFKKYCGTTPHAYIVHKRIAHAKQLIEEGQTASQAGYSVGFGDYSAFYRAYVKIVGKSPSA